MTANADYGAVADGVPIEIRDAAGDWHPRVARSGVFLNRDYVFGRQVPWLVVQVSWSSDDDDHVVNWPAADVRLLPPNDGSRRAGPAPDAPAGR